ncbi:MAG: hypothetical protein GY757_17385, partial [bacterium]|nr:hypothetical protein [bacterium]
KEQKEFWQKQFTGELPVLNLPTDYPRPLEQRFEGDNITFTMNPAEAEGVKKTARTNETTLYMTTLAIFTIILSKLSGQEDIIIGTPTAGRRQTELEKIIGMFVNTLAIRNKPHSDKTIREYLKEVKTRTLQAFENQDYQFEDLVEALSVKRETERNPIFDVMFSQLNQPENHPQIQSTQPVPSTTTTSTTPPPLRTSKFDLSLELQTVDGELIFNIEYSRKLFKKDTIKKITGYLEKAAAGIIQNPEIKLKEIEIISP